MASVEVGMLHARLSEDEIAELMATIKAADLGRLPKPDESAGGLVAEGLDEDVMDEFMDRLDGNDVAADIYLPLDFEGSWEAVDLRLASLYNLQEVLEAIAEDLDIETDEDEDEDDEEAEEEEDSFESEMELLEERLRHVWRVMFDGAQQALESGLCLIISR